MKETQAPSEEKKQRGRGIGLKFGEPPISVKFPELQRRALVAMGKLKQDFIRAAVTERLGQASFHAFVGEEDRTVFGKPAISVRFPANLREPLVEMGRSKQDFIRAVVLEKLLGEESSSKLK